MFGAAITAPPGAEWCRQWTAQVDAALVELLDQRSGVAVVALGGYARRELCPASDVDLLLLHDGWGRHDLEQLVAALCYPLWDARLSVGHAVRTPAEAVADAGRVDTATALLDRRLVAGDRGLHDALASRVQRWSKRHGKSLLRDLAAADEARHAEAGAHPGMLEPDLKNGAGGLRDIHSLRWAAGWLVGEMGLDPLVAAGYLGADDRRRLSQANDTLLRARCALHQSDPAVRGKAVDVLRLDRQDEVAALLSAAGPPVDADGLLRDVGLAMRLAGHLHRRTWDRVLADSAGRRRRRRLAGRDLGGGLHLAHGQVHLDDVDLTEDPAAGLRAMAVAAANDAHLSRSTAARVSRQARQLRTVPWDGRARSALLTLLHAGEAVADALSEADHVGLLAAHIPEWELVRGRPQRNPLHRFDLDTHGAEAVVALHALRRDERLEGIWNRLRDPDVVVLAAWLHDVGKAWPGDHSVAGAGVARRWLSDMGFDDGVVDQVTHLVRHHLLLPDTATRRDLDDDDVIDAVAGVVGDPDMLDALYLLSLADSRATGPAAWSPWKENLLATLHARTRRRLRGEQAAPDDDPRAAAVGAGADPRQIDALSSVAPARYFQIASASQVAVHAALLTGPDAVGVDLRPGAVHGTTVVSIVAPDRPRLLADCAGALAASDLAVVEARAVTGERGVALEWFTVTGPVGAGAVTALLHDAAEDRVDVAALVERPRRGEADVSSVLRRPPRVTVDGNTVEVDATDRRGLLYLLCRAITDAGCAIESVRASTLGPSVYDVFALRPGQACCNREVMLQQLTTVAQRPL